MECRMGWKRVGRPDQREILNSVHLADGEREDGASVASGDDDD